MKQKHTKYTQINANESGERNNRCVLKIYPAQMNIRSLRNDFL